MLKSLDILIGLSVVMLIVSMAVTLINQGVLAIIAKRGRCLQTGLTDLLQLVDARLTRIVAEDIAARVLTQPTIRRMKYWSWVPDWFPSWYQFGDVIHREELTKIIISIGAPQDEIKKKLSELKAAIDEKIQEKVTTALSALKDAIDNYPSIPPGSLDDELKGFINNANLVASFDKLEKSIISFVDPLLERLIDALKANGIEDPSKTMENVRMFSLQLEKTHPELASDVRQNNALLQEASSQFLAKINLGFDQIMDRVSSRFTYNTRVVTLISAALVSVVLQLDTVNLINRLAMDDKMRAAFVEQGMKLMKDEKVKKKVESAAKPEAKGTAPAEEKTQPAVGAGGGVNDPANTNEPVTGGKPAQTDATASNASEAGLETQKYYMKFLAVQGIINLPANGEDWCKQWDKVNITGLILSIFLLSLGAPFWYNALGKLLQLRSILAQKDDEQKLTRQTAQAQDASSRSSSSGAQPSPVRGERGDLNAVA